MTVDVNKATTEARRTQILSLLRAFNEHDAERVLSHFTEDVVWEDPMVDGPLIGGAAAKEQVEAIFRAFPDLAFPLDDAEVYFAADPAKAVSSWHWIGTMTGPIEPPGFQPTGKRVDVKGTCQYEFREGLIARHTVLYDVLGMSQRLGLMPANDSLAVKALVGAEKVKGRLAKSLAKH